MVKNKTLIFLILILLIGAFLRFYKLDWAQGFFTHPDEYHIVISVNQLSFPEQMHPNFFSYGTFTIYLVYFSIEFARIISQIFNLDTNPNSPLFNPFLVGRFISAVFSTLTILVVFKISEILLKNKKLAFIAALLIALTPGLIQQAHFATPESNLTFLLFLSLFFTLKFLKNNKLNYLILASVSLGLSFGTKISSIVFSLPLIFVIISNSFAKLNRLGERFILFIFITTAAFFLSAPFVFLDYKAFNSNVTYEGSLAIGKILVSYTRQFIDTIPILFQIEKIFPYALGPAVLVMSILGFTLSLFYAVKNKDTKYIIFILAFLALFLPNAFLFTKWTRFVAPTFPFFTIFSVIFLDFIFRKNKKLGYITGIILATLTVLWSVAFFSIYTRNDVRIDASKWLRSNLPQNSTILVESGNMIDVPLGGQFQKTSLDFYKLEEDPLTRSQIANSLYNSDYFIIQSRRVFMNHKRLPHIYPRTAKFYDLLFDGKLGFELVKTFTSYPQLNTGKWKLEFPDEKAEETWSVFDHPVIRVFKKNAQLTREGYIRSMEK